VRVSDQYLPIKDEQSFLKGYLRAIIYLEDLGELAN
jgi:hypothetical protein